MKNPFGKLIKLNTRRLALFFLLLVLFFLLTDVHIRSQAKFKEQQVSANPSRGGALFVNQIDSVRLSRLFDRLQAVEDKHFANNGQNSDLANRLGLISFERIKQIKRRNLTDADLPEYGQLAHEIDEFLDLDETGRITPSAKFISFLKNKSEFFSYLRPRERFVRKKLSQATSDVKPVILMSANYKYFQPLKNSLALVKTHFPQWDIIIYDMGFPTKLVKEISELCNCTLKKFDPDGVYQRISPHAANLNTYTWKPLIIQETFKEHDTVIYMDTSIKLASNEIEHIIKTVKDVGILSRYIKLFVSCFTDERMLEWFDEQVETFNKVFSLEANLLIFHRNLVSSLIMKAWVSCALERDCIAPLGSHIYGGPSNWINGCSPTSCGCHRFDQDALAIVNTYFFGIPGDFAIKPAFSFTDQENFFYSLNRRTVRQYIHDQISSLLVVMFSWS